MEKLTGKANIKTFDGRPLSEYGIKDSDGNLITEINLEFPYEGYSDFKEVQDAKDEMSAKEQIDFRNNTRKGNALAAARESKLKALGFVKKTAENDDYIRLKDTFDLFMLAKNKDGSPRHTVESASALAVQAIGCEWPEGKEPK